MMKNKKLPGKPIFLSVLMLAVMITAGGIVNLYAQANKYSKKSKNKHRPAKEMAAYLPQAGELKKWESTDEPQYVKDEDLFLLINGGADIYHEYGFKQAITQGFKFKSKDMNLSQLQFNLEIYEMKNAKAAYGIYTFKTGDSGKTIAVGTEGLLEDYYLNFWKGNFLVTITGFNSGKETVTGIIAAAKVVAGKIKSTGKTPCLLNLLPQMYKNQLKPNGIKYLKGNLALFNNYDFASGDIFGLKEGVIGYYRDFTLFVFKYPDTTECRQYFEYAGSQLKKNPHFSDFAQSDNTFSFSDRKGSSFYIQGCKRYILTLRLPGKKIKQTPEIVKRIRENIPQIAGD